MKEILSVQTFWTPVISFCSLPVSIQTFWTLVASVCLLPVLYHHFSLILFLLLQIDKKIVRTEIGVLLRLSHPNIVSTFLTANNDLKY